MAGQCGWRALPRLSLLAASRKRQLLLNLLAPSPGVIALTKTVAREYAGRGIVANSVAPGFIETGEHVQGGKAEQSWSATRAKLQGFKERAGGAEFAGIFQRVAALGSCCRPLMLLLALPRSIPCCADMTAKIDQKYKARPAAWRWPRSRPMQHAGSAGAAADV